MNIDINKNKRDFIGLCHNNIKREGLNEILQYLETETDFFTAPASSHFHLACPGGLVQHSINVYRRLVKEYIYEYSIKFADIKPEVLESLTVMSLFHDICKANYYVEDVRNVKENGVWKQVPYYKVNEKLSLGHGEKSVMLLLNHGMRLTDEEMVGINAHMGFSDTRVRGGDFSIVNIWDQYPVAMLLHIADLKASKIDEKES